MERVIKKYDELTLDELYEIIKLRMAVFVEEQQCCYQDLDDIDKRAIHVYLHDGHNILAYLRIIDNRPDGDVLIGRVLSVKRNCGYGAEVMRVAINFIKNQLDADAIKIHAQTYSQGFYEKLGFKPYGDIFIEADRPHTHMILKL